jgi:alpha-tubulin suppressor-like RCC1 family protein
MDATTVHQQPIRQKGPAVISELTAIAAGTDYMLGLTRCRHVVVYGEQRHQFPGTDTGIGCHDTGLTNIIHIAAGYNTAYAVADDGTLYEHTRTTQTWTRTNIADVATCHVVAHAFTGTRVVNDLTAITRNRDLWATTDNTDAWQKIADNVDDGIHVAGSTLLLRDGRVLAHGNNDFNRLSVGADVLYSGDWTDTGLRNIVHIYANGNMSAAVRNDGTLYVCGAVHGKFLPTSDAAYWTHANVGAVTDVDLRGGHVLCNDGRMRHRYQTTLAGTSNTWTVQGPPTSSTSPRSPTGRSHSTPTATCTHAAGSPRSTPATHRTNGVRSPPHQPATPSPPPTRASSPKATTRATRSPPPRRFTADQTTLTDTPVRVDPVHHPRAACDALHEVTLHTLGAVTKTERRRDPVRYFCG